MFLTTFGISNFWLTTIFKKIKRNNCISTDRRGKHGNCGNKISVQTTTSITDHINSFPRVESHYVRKKTNKEYLEENWSISSMHNAYKKWLTDNKINCTPASFHQYSDVFNTQFNIGFFKPKKYQCDTCVSQENRTPEEQILNQHNYYLHLKNKDRAQELKYDDKKDALKEENKGKKVVACFDYQKVLPVPKAETSISYYKRKLSVYNFTIYDLVSHEAKCYCYDETIGNKGSNEVASFIYILLK